MELFMKGYICIGGQTFRLWEVFLINRQDTSINGKKGTSCNARNFSVISPQFA